MNWRDDELPAFGPEHYRVLDRPVRNWSARTPAGIALSAIIVHATEDDRVPVVLETFNNPAEQRSSHYLIDRDGTTYQLVRLEHKAWHAGVSTLWGIPDLNECSIGVELVAVEPEPYTEAQLTALLALTIGLCAAAPGILLNRIVGHEHIAPGRKTDPGRAFPWREFLAAVGYHLTRRLSP